MIPSTAILIGVGGLVATGGLEFMPLWIGASLGALIGSTFSYWLGGRFGTRMLTVWPLSKDPALVARGTWAFCPLGGADGARRAFRSDHCARWPFCSRGCRRCG